jgi:hypothetical protein
VSSAKPTTELGGNGCHWVETVTLPLIAMANKKLPTRNITGRLKPVAQLPYERTNWLTHTLTTTVVVTAAAAAAAVDR